MRFEQIKTTDCDEFKSAYELYKVSFPLHEQRLPKAQQAALAHPEYHFYNIYDGEIFVGILPVWESSEFVYVEHFAILQNIRGKSYGTKALEKLCNSECAGKTVILEIDPPIDEVSKNRRHFYERLGFVQNSYEHIHPPYAKENLGHKLVVMSYPSVLSDELYKQFYAYLSHVVMSFV